MTHPLPAGAAPPPDLKASYDYMPALDGLRAVSIALVIVAHSGLGDKVPGLLGVLVFFVISGFLLTRQMIAEIRRGGTLSLRGFYLRRVLRLGPALLAYITASTLILTALGAVIAPVHVLSALLYFANYYEIFTGFPPHNPVPILWSLAVEEHYYIVFPLLMIACRRDPRRILPLLALLVTAALAWRLYLFGHCEVAGTWLAGEGVCGRTRHVRIHGTDILFDCILDGAIAALVLDFHDAFARRWLLRRDVFVAAAAVLLATLLYREPMFRDTLRLSLQGLCIALLIANILFHPGLGAVRRVLSLRPALFLGRISYSLYLFHFGFKEGMFIVLGTDHILGHPAALLAYYLGSGLLATASYYGIERPMLRLRRRRGSHQPDRAAAAMPPPNQPTTQESP